MPDGLHPLDRTNRVLPSPVPHIIHVPPIVWRIAERAATAKYGEQNGLNVNRFIARAIVMTASADLFGWPPTLRTDEIVAKLLEDV